MPIRTTETARVPEDISGRQRRMPVGGITWRHTFRALRHRNYRLFFWGQLVSLIGTWMQQTAMSWYVYQITNSKLLLGVVSAVGSAPMMLSSIWGGALADLHPKRSILVTTQAAQMICAFLVAVGVAMCFFLNGLSFIAVIGGLMMMRLPLFERKIEIVSAGEHAWEGILYSIKHPRVRTILLLFLAVGVFGWSYAVLMPAFARDVLGRSANGYGILMSASGTGAFVGALVVATYGHLFTPRRLALGGVWLFSAALFALSFTKSFPVALVFLFAAGFGMLLFFSTSNTVLQTIVPDEMRGRVMGVWSLVFGAMIPLGSLEAGAVAHFVGTPLALAFGAIICAASALVTLCVIRRREAQHAR